MTKNLIIDFYLIKFLEWIAHNNKYFKKLVETLYNLYFKDLTEVFLLMVKLHLEKHILVLDQNLQTHNYKVYYQEWLIKYLQGYNKHLAILSLE